MPSIISRSARGIACGRLAALGMHERICIAMDHERGHLDGRQPLGAIAVRDDGRHLPRCALGIDRPMERLDRTAPRTFEIAFEAGRTDDALTSRLRATYPSRSSGVGDVRAAMASGVAGGTSWPPVVDMMDTMLFKRWPWRIPMVCTTMPPREAPHSADSMPRHPTRRWRHRPCHPGCRGFGVSPAMSLPTSSAISGTAASSSFVDRPTSRLSKRIT